MLPLVPSGWESYRPLTEHLLPSGSGFQVNSLYVRTMEGQQTFLWQWSSCFLFAWLAWPIAQSELNLSLPTFLPTFHFTYQRQNQRHCQQHVDQNTLDGPTANHTSDSDDVDRVKTEWAASSFETHVWGPPPSRHHQGLEACLWLDLYPRPPTQSRNRLIGHPELMNEIKLSS